MPRRSAGLLLYRLSGATEVLLVHPGGPYWKRKDLGAWSIPKGEYGPGEDALAAARREFAEELGQQPPSSELFELGEFRQPGGKLVRAWALEGDCDPEAVVSNTFEIEWPPRSGAMSRFPEVDRAEWFVLGEAKRRILKGQVAILERLTELVGPGEP